MANNLFKAEHGLAAAGNSIIYGDLTVTGNLNVSGSSTSTPGSDFLPVSNNIGLGDADQRWKLFATTGDFSGNVVIGGTLAVTGNTTLSGANNSILGNTRFDTNVLVIDAVNNRVGILNTTPDASLTITGTSNTSGNVWIGGNLTVVGNTTTVNLYSTGTINAVAHTVGTSFVANSTVLSTTGGANVTGALWVGSANVIGGSSWLANSTGLYHTGAINAASITVGSSFIANSTRLQTTGTANISGNTWIGGTLTVAGNTTFNGASLTVNGNVSITGVLSGSFSFTEITQKVINFSNPSSNVRFVQTVGGNTIWREDVTTTNRVLNFRSFNDSGTTNTVALSLTSAGYMTIASGATLNGTSIINGDLDVNGEITATGDISAYSDEALKTNIQPITGALDLVNRMQGISFYEKNNSKRKRIGFVAQELKKVLPEAVREEKNGLYSVAYMNLSAVLVEAIKELNEKIDSIKK